MARVLGLGGVFFKAPDPTAVADWYARVLGFPVEGWGGVAFAHPTVGQVVWAPFATESSHFDPSPAPWMINLLVDDLDGVLALALAAGVEPVGLQSDDEQGKFAWLMDPMGVKVELWEPPAATPE